MNRLHFISKESQLVYDKYIEDCSKHIKILSPEDQQDCLMEVNSYIYEYMQDHMSEDENTALTHILERLGDPAITLREVVAYKKVIQATKTYSLKHILEAIYLNLRNGFVYIFLALLALVMISMPVLAVLKVIYPDKIGLWIGDGNFVLGTVEGNQQVSEYLGDFFIPFVMIFSVVLYFIIILILKFLKNRK